MRNHDITRAKIVHTPNPVADILIKAAEYPAGAGMIPMHLRATAVNRCRPRVSGDGSALPISNSPINTSATALKAVADYEHPHHSPTLSSSRKHSLAL